MQNTIIHPDAILEIESIIKKYAADNIFLITGKDSYKNSGAKNKIKDSLKGRKITHFWDFKTNPEINDLQKGISVFNKSKCEIIISVGGGSVIDMAKLINYFYNFKNFAQISNFDNIVNSAFSPKQHICIPTTAGSGSEATQFAVMYITEKKYSIENPGLLPAHVLIDPLLHISQTDYQKAVSGLDALTQSIESIWSNKSNNESKKFALKSLKILWNNLRELIKKGDIATHSKIAEAANLAGKAINISKTTACHAISYGLTSKYKIPHGHAVAITLPYFLEYNYDINEKNCNDKRGVEYVINTMKSIYDIIGASSPQNAKDIMINFIKDLNIITKEKINIELVISCIDKNRLANNPKKMLDKNIRAILYELKKSKLCN